jgi:hypothetical protein
MLTDEARGVKRRAAADVEQIMSRGQAKVAQKLKLVYTHRVAVLGTTENEGLVFRRSSSIRLISRRLRIRSDIFRFQIKS